MTKLNSLEDRIYKYLKQGTFADLKIVAKNIVEICEEYIKLKGIDYGNKKLVELTKQIKILQDKLNNKSIALSKIIKQYGDIKFLSYEEVEKILNEYKEGGFDGESEWEEIPDYNFNKLITAICNLAISGKEAKITCYDCRGYGICEHKYPVCMAGACYDFVRKSNIAIKPITKDRIIERLKKYFSKDKSKFYKNIYDVDFLTNMELEAIASEILNNKEGE